MGADIGLIDPEFKSRVAYEVQLLASRTDLRTIVARKQAYWELIQAELAAHRLPEVLGYVACVESHFDTTTRGPGGGVGMWQLTPAIARRLHLKVDDECTGPFLRCTATGEEAGGVDERLDAAKSTRAAADYLELLLEGLDTDSSLLAIAAWQREEQLRAAVVEQPRKDFWSLYWHHGLPADAMKYVSQVLAAAIVCSDPPWAGGR